MRRLSKYAFDPGVRDSLEEVERATGNPVRVHENPDGSIFLDFRTPGKEEATVGPAKLRPSRRERRRKRRRG